LADHWRACRPARGHGGQGGRYGLIGDIIVGIIGDIIVGIIGAIIAGWLLPRIGIIMGGGFIAAVMNAFIGTVILLIILGLLPGSAGEAAAAGCLRVLQAGRA
jgi:uncharacterized membrane protein YeaQ/YmgE (transglycosylase-associated protein family)